MRMRNRPLPGLCKKSPIRQDVDTTWADKVFSGAKVDESLKKSGHHTEGSLRGKKDTTPSVGANVGMGNRMINTELT